MAIDENRIPLDIRDYSHTSHDEFDIEGFEFTPSEHKYIPNFVDMGDCVIHVEVLNAISMMTLTLSLEGACHLRDEHDGSIIEYELEDSVDVIIAPESEAEKLLDVLHKGCYSAGAAVIGRITEEDPGLVIMNTELGTRTMLPQPGGELLPRIC